MILLVLLPALLLVVYNASEQRRFAREVATDQALQVAQLAVSNHERLVSATEQMLIALAQLPMVQNADGVACNELFARLLEQYGDYSNLFAVDTEGISFCSGVPLDAPVSAAERIWFQRIRETNRFTSGNYQIGLVTRRPVVTFAYPIFDADNEVMGYVAASLDLDWVSLILEQTPIDSDTTVTAIDNTGTIFYRYPNDGASIGTVYPNAELVNTITSTRRGTTEQTGISGTRRLFAFAPLLESDAYVLIGITTSSVFENVDRLLLQSLVSLGGVGILVETTRRFATGQMDQRVDPKTMQGTNELSDLASAFNDMAVSLQHRQVALFKEIDERRRAQQELQEARDNLERKVEERTAMLKNANDEISTFAYIISHDLRSPLVNLRGFTGELQESIKFIREHTLPRRDLTEAQHEALSRVFERDIPEALDFVVSAVRRMDSLTGAVLKLSRLGRRDLTLTRVDVAHVVQTIVDTLAFQLKQKNSTVSIRQMPHVLSDQIAIEQIMGNLITNAVQYLSPDRPGRIEVWGEEREDDVRFCVRDNGRGIAPDDHHKVFEPFRRAGKQDTPGEGMGLAYVQTLIRRLGGLITFTSEPGVGTTFIVSLPKPNSRFAPDEIRENAG
jgi:signal transduction histidine kinase